MDDYDPRSGGVLLAATNRPEVLDPALLRAGRFDRQILVDRPDERGRIDLLRVHVRNVRTDEGVDIEQENHIAVLMGGHAAEYVIFSHFSTRAADDLARVADIARSIVTRYAMEPDLGQAGWALPWVRAANAGPPRTPQRLYGEDTAREIDCAVRRNVLKAFDRATAVLADNRDLLE